MSKKWMAIAGVALVAVVLVVALLLLNRNSSSSITPNSNAASSSTSGTTSSTTSTGTGTTQGQSATTTAGMTTGTNPSKTTASGAGTGSTTGGLKPFPQLPTPKIAAAAPTSPIAAGQTLPPLTEAPSNTISGLKLGEVPTGATYTIVMRPYGIGPSIVLGSRLAVRVDSVKPVGGAPANSHMANANVLVLMDTTLGGTVTKGGTYTATVRFLSDGSKLLPVMSHATLAK